MTDRPRYFATHRLFTGSSVSRGYVYDRTTGQAVCGCPHRHTQRRLKEWDASGTQKVIGGGVFAQRCAERMLRRFLLAASPEGEGT